MFGFSFKTWLRRIRQGKCYRRPYRHNSWPHLRLEILEDRTLLAGSILATLSSTGVLTVTGTAGNDFISIRQDVGQILVFDQSIQVGTEAVAQVPAARVNSIVVQGMAGNDVIRLDQGSQPITIGASITGGSGTDFIVGGAGNDTITGGNALDTIWGGGGNDTLAGGIIPSSASEAVRDGLTAVSEWAGQQSLPLLGEASGLQQALQSGLIDPISTYLDTGQPTDTGFLNLLQGLTRCDRRLDGRGRSQQRETSGFRQYHQFFARLPGDLDNAGAPGEPGTAGPAVWH